MKITTFDDYCIGIIDDDVIYDVTNVLDAVDKAYPEYRTLRVIEKFNEYKPKIVDVFKSSSGKPISSVKIGPPLTRMSNIVCMAVNYMEDGTRNAPAPINAFHKTPAAIIGQGGTVVLPDEPFSIFEGEAEIALIIGKTASHVSEADALSHVFGYMNFIDGSARDLGPARNNFYPTKSRATFAPTGPYILTADEIADPHKLSVRLSVNGNVRQHYNTDDMAHRIPRCISWVSATHTLYPGDVIALGTNHRGLSAMQDGDLVELEVEGLGKLSVNVKDPLKREWERDTRLERAEKGLEGRAPQIAGKYLSN